jgi:endonuclease YncB( thermonuclease family)
MAKAIEEISSRFVGHFGLGTHGQRIGSPKSEIHDGDTINVRALGDFSVRFLGIDTPEISYRLPGQDSFISLSNTKWEDFLTDPFAGAEGAQFSASLSTGLRDHLANAVGSGVANNHYRHAFIAQRELERQVEQDIADQGETNESFRFFLSFAFEKMERFGRLLVYINRDQKATPRPLDYNSRMLQAGIAAPYFIWPNINPFRRIASLLEAIPNPGTANTLANRESTLRDARAWVNDTRTNGVGLFDSQDPLRLMPFELRFLAERREPVRWVIDLSKNDDTLIPPQDYYTIQNIEDRLFIPSEYITLFKEKGWKTA